MSEAVKLFIVKAGMSSGNFIDESKDLDEKRRELTYKFEKVKRKKIQACRMRFKDPIYKKCLKFHSMYVTNEAGKEMIEKTLLEADSALKEIDPSLKATPKFIPLDVNEMVKGGLYNNLIDAIKGQVFQKTFDKIEKQLKKKDTGKMTDRTKAALLHMVDQCRNLNVINDKDIAATIDAIQKKIETETFKPLRDEMAEHLTRSRDRFDAVEII